MKTNVSIFICAILLGVSSLQAATFTADNEILSVNYDDAAQVFSVADRVSGKTFLTNGKLDGAAVKADVGTARDATFGKGRKITVTQADGGVVTLALYKELPFLLISKEMRNRVSTDLDVARLVSATYVLEMGSMAGALKTIGTGGLHPADKHAGSYLFLTVADPVTLAGVVTGWITQDRGSGVVFSDAKEGKVGIKAQIDYGRLRIPAGRTAQSETLAIGYFRDARVGEELYAGAIQKQYKIKLRAPEAVYCSWYAEKHGFAGDEKSTVELAKFAARELKPFGFGVVQIDDEWQAGGKFNGPRRGFDRVRPGGPYANGIAPVAAEVGKTGLTFGLWWLPFGRNFQDPEYKDRQDWFVKRLDGRPYDTAWGGTCLDLTHPAVKQHLSQISKLYRSWGVKYYKMDGLWTGAACEQIYVNDGYRDDHFGNNQPFHDPSVSNVEAYRSGLKLIRQSAGEDVFFSGCCVSQNMREMTAIGLVDSMRVGPDASGDIRVGTLRGSRLYFLNGRVWWNDPDPAVARAAGSGMGVGPVTLEEARLTTSWVAMSGQFFLLSDWLPNLPPERIEILKRTMLHHDAPARPVDYFERDIPNTWMVTDSRQTVRRDVIGLFNYDGNAININHTSERLGLDPHKTYHAFDFWANAPLSDFAGTFNAQVEPRSCRVIAVRANEGHPVLISTSRHVTQGIVDVTGETWSRKTLSATSGLIANDPYELRIAGTRDGGKLWKEAGVTLSAADKAAGVTTRVEEAPGLLRVTMTSPVTRKVQWTVKFIEQPLPAISLTGLKAEMRDFEAPVSLSWQGTAAFYDIMRDGVTIAAGHFGLSYGDATAPLGKTVTYSVKIPGRDMVATTSLTTKVFNPGPVPPLPEISLAKLTPRSVHVGWGAMTMGNDVGGGPLVLSGQTYPDGVGLHAPAEAVYVRPVDAKRFVAIVGIDDSQRKDPRASICCSMVAEDASGKMIELGKTPVMRSGKIEQFNFDLSLPADCAKVRLVVTDAGDGIACDHADWANAGFRR